MNLLRTLRYLALGLVLLKALPLAHAQPSAVAPGPLTPDAAAPVISLNFQDIELRALMQVFADFTGLNFVTTDRVTGQVSLRLQDLPWAAMVMRHSK